MHWYDWGLLILGALVLVGLIVGFLDVSRHLRGSKSRRDGIVRSAFTWPFIIYSASVVFASTALLIAAVTAGAVIVVAWVIVRGNRRMPRADT